MKTSDFDFDLLRELCSLDGVSGYEQDIAKLIVERIKMHCTELYIDRLGNVIAFKKGKKARKKNLMLCAHMDEVGFAITSVCDDGTFSFSQVGIMTEVLPSRRVRVGKSALPGVISSKPIHLISDKNAPLSLNDLCIDIGCSDKTQAQELNLIGEFASFDSDFCFFGENLIKSKALDDRVGCTIMCMIIAENLEYDTYFAFTVGEELGGVGATAATNQIKPDVCLLLEGTTASDIPGNTGQNKVCLVGKGPVCPFMDGGTLYDKDMYTCIRNIANAHNLPSQTKTKVAGGTDGARIQRALSGVKVGAISLPCRYIHTSSSVASTEDMENMLSLTQKAVNYNFDEIFI